MSGEMKPDLQRLARIIRERADNPVANNLHPEFVDGFAYGLRCAADILDALALGVRDLDDLQRAVSS